LLEFDVPGAYATKSNRGHVVQGEFRDHDGFTYYFDNAAEKLEDVRAWNYQGTANNDGGIAWFGFDGALWKRKMSLTMGGVLLMDQASTADILGAGV
jgi:hypothetical protein